LGIVSGCLRCTPTDDLPILAGIQLTEVRRIRATLSLARRAMEPGHLLHSTLTRPPSAHAQHIKSRHPFVPAAHQLISFSEDNNNIRAADWADHQWNVELADNLTRLPILSPDIGTHSPGREPPKQSLGPA